MADRIVFTLTMGLADAPMPTLNTMVRQSGRWVKKKWQALFLTEIQDRFFRLSPATRAKFPLARARLRLEVHYCGIEPDLDNVYGGTAKIISDALVVGGILSDDKPSVLELLPIRMVRVAHKVERKVIVDVLEREDTA